LIDLNDVTPPPRAVHYNLEAIVARLRERAESWVPQLFANGRRVADEWRLANIRGDAPRKNGSCVIALKGERAGDWHEFDGGQGGGPISTIEQATGLVDRALFARAAEIAGWTEGAPIRQQPPQAPARPERDVLREIGLILDRVVPIFGTVAERYLRARGVAPPSSPDLLFHADLVHWESRRGFPGLVAIVRDLGGQRIAIHRTYLTEDGAKAPVDKPRMMLGPVAGGAVRLAEIGDTGVLGIAEGIETALSVMTACPQLPVWATLSAPNLEQVQLPPAARRIIILADHDASGAGARAAETAARRLRAEGLQVVIAIPPEPGDDFNDLLLRAGPAAVAAVVQAGRLAGAADEAAAPAAAGRHLPIGFAEPVGTLPALRADEGDLDRAVSRAWSVLLASNRPPWLFRAGGLPTWIVPDDEGRPVATMINDERLRHMLAKLAVWCKLSRTGDMLPAHPPTTQIKSVLATPDPNLPVLAGIVMTPVFGRGGTLLTEPGYHPDARLLYRPAPGFEVSAIPERPTNGQIEQARSLLLDDLLGDFPFTSLAERAHAVALLLLGFLRAMVEGPTPLHLIEKPTPGTGATLMVDALATILTGAGASVMTEGRDDEEWRKRLTAKLRQIPAFVLIDNLRHELDSSALAAALTAPFWEDRILGISEMIRLPIRCIWIATGNNPSVSNEMARRLVRIRLDARVDQPWRRGGFRHPDLMAWVRANRGRLVAASLTLCRAWIAAGRPRGTRSIGSYDAWAETLGGVLAVTGIEGFLANLDEMMEASDGEGALWRSFVALWWDRFGTADVGTSDLFEVARLCEPPLPLGAGGDRSQRTRLGKALGRMRDRVFRLEAFHVRIVSAGMRHQAMRWRLAFDDNAGVEKRSLRSPDGAVGGNVGESRGTLSSDVPTENYESHQDVGEHGERGERFSILHARAGAHVKESREKRSPPSPPSPTIEKPTEIAGERAGEGGLQPPPATPPPWLDGVPLMRPRYATGPPAPPQFQKRVTTASSARLAPDVDRGSRRRRTSDEADDADQAPARRALARVDRWPRDARGHRPAIR